MQKDWLPGSMSERLDMAKRWSAVLTESTPAPWGVPQSVVTELNAKIDAAQTALDAAAKEERTPSMNQAIRTAFGELVAVMRGTRKRYFFIPPMTEADWVRMGMRLLDTTPTNIAPPDGRVTAFITRPAQAALGFQIAPADGGDYDSRAEWGFRIYWGVLPHGGASETDHLERQHLLRVPVRPEELPQSHFTRRRRDRLNFEFDESAMTAYICIRYENGKGDKGPWGPMISAVIP